MRHLKQTLNIVLSLSCVVFQATACSSSSKDSKEQQKYTVVFNPNGGERIGGGELVQQFTSSEEIVSPILEKTGYTFTSWDKEISTLISDSVLTASWSVNQYNVSYIANDTNMGAVTGNGTRFDYGSLVTVNATANTGYVFNGWYESENLKSAYTSYSFIMGDANVSLVAQFSKNNNVPYKVLHYQQNIVDDSYSLVDTDTLYGSTNELTNVEAHSYDGFTPKEFNQISINGDGSSIISIYYDRQKFNITFEANGDGSVSKSSLLAKYGSEVRKDGDTVYVGSEEVKATPKQKDGEYTYSFINWTNASGLITDNKVITANFSKTENIYRVTFDIGNYGMTPCFEEVGYDSKVSEPTEQSHEGVIFKGWYKEKECVNKWDFDVDTIKCDTTLYACWELIEYSITYQYPTSAYFAYSMPEGYVSSYNIETPTFDLPILQSRKYNFKGWFINDACTGTAITSIEQGTIGNKTFYTDGIGMEIKGIITFHNVEGATSLPKSYFYIDETYNLKDATKDFCQFDGWYSDANFTSKVESIDTSYKHDINLYAKWIELTITEITASCNWNNYKVGKTVSYDMSTAEAVVKAHLSNDTYLKLTPKYNSEIVYTPGRGHVFTNADLKDGETVSTKAIGVEFRGFTTSFNVTVYAREFAVNWDTTFSSGISLRYDNIQDTIYSNTSSYTFKVKTSDDGSYSANYKVTFGNTVIVNNTNFTFSGSSYTTLTFDIDSEILEAAALADPDAFKEELPILKIAINKN